MQTPSQTVGPYFAYGLAPEQYGYDFKSAFGNGASPDRQKDTLTVMGKVYDGEGRPIPDAMIEIWQNDGEKQFFGRFGTGTDPENRFIFHAPKPASVEGQAPFFVVIVFMRGQLIHSFTRMYFSDESELNARDEALNAVPSERRHTLVAQKNGDAYVFDIRMQGDDETVFFDV